MTAGIITSSIERLKEALVLIVIHLKVKCINLAEYLRVIFKYYRSRTFFKIDACLLLSYLFANPFRLSKQFLLQKRGARCLYLWRNPSHHDGNDCPHLRLDSPGCCARNGLRAGQNMLLVE